MALTIFFIIILFLALVQTAIPYLVKRTIVFGVTIPEKHIHDKRLTSYKKRYAVITFLISIILLGIFTTYALTVQPTEDQMALIGTFILFAIILISMSLYFYFHGKTIQLKKANKWVENLKQVQMTDLSIRSQDEMLPWYVYLLPIIVTLGLIVYTIPQYDILPDQIPTHWGPNGEADAFTAKSPISAIQLPLVLFVMQLMFLGIHFAQKNSGIKLSATSKAASQKRQLTLRKYTSWFLFLTSLLVTMLFSFLQLTTIHPDIFKDTTMIAMPFVFILVILIGTIIFAVKVGRADKQSNVQFKGEITDKDEDMYWKGGLFYFNKNDPSIFVEKRFSVGWTLNLANPIGYLVLFGPIILILLITFL
ncbi:putative membrane protein [Cytobacillus eiseniae]|uniref:Membrane protein n=1 Tax=Cytobacillus eiseniae TaxID=762947 RepID=A0ABS4RIE5_9BACI|nr:DUF5808 domain-containing protein [Cytobacillus eiseniae]MBP2242675.1 putative membrane protein [Cytobacillus eiseniae]